MSQNSLTQPGKYLARAEGPDSVQMGTSKSGTEQIAVSFRILDPQTKEPTDTTIQWIGNFANDKSFEITAKALRACGWQGDDLEDLRGIDSEIVELDVQWDEYDGKRRLRVKWVNRPGAGVVFKDKLGDGAKKSLSTRMRGFLARAGAPAAPAPSAEGASDDIPF